MERKENDFLKQPEEKLLRDEADEAWKTIGYVYTPKGVKPPKTFDFSLENKKQPGQGEDFKKETLTTKEPKVKDNPLEKIEENAPRNIYSPPTPILTPTTDYHGDHVFVPEYERDYSGVTRRDKALGFIYGGSCFWS